MAQIIAIKFNQVERVQKNAAVSIPTHKEQLEASNTVFATRNRLTIDDAGVGPPSVDAKQLRSPAPGLLCFWPRSIHQNRERTRVCGLVLRLTGGPPMALVGSGRGGSCTPRLGCARSSPDACKPLGLQWLRWSPLTSLLKKAELNET